jgi:hypothetical protein
MASLNYNGSFLNSLNGIFGELLIYKKALSDNQIKQLNNYLALKWNLS